MIPIGGIVGGILAARRGGGRGSDPVSVNVAARFLLVVFGGAAVIGLAERAPIAGAPALVAFVVLVFLPSFTLTRVLVPLGLPRAAHAFARISPPVSTSGEIRAAAVFYGALAALRARSLDASVVPWLEESFTRSITLRATSLGAAGLLAVLRDRPESARLFFASVDGLAWRTAPRVVRRVARSWLVADAARRGDFRAVASLGRRRRSLMRWPWLMGAIAERLVGDPRAPSDAVLRVAWLVAPRRRATWPMVRRALAAPRVARGALGGPEPSSDPLKDALAAHAACLLAPSDRTLAAAGRAWDAAREAPALRALVARRALSLEVRSEPDAVIARLFAEVAADLDARVASCAPAVVEASATLRGAARRARQRDLDEIDVLAKRLARRTAQKEALHTLEEWMEWASLRRICERTLRDADAHLRRTVFSSVYSAACNYAVWMFNLRGEKLFAHGIFRWLLEAGAGVADESAVKLLKKNVAAGHGP